MLAVTPYRTGIGCKSANINGKTLESVADLTQGRWNPVIPWETELMPRLGSASASILRPHTQQGQGRELDQVVGGGKALLGFSWNLDRGRYYGTLDY